MAIIVALNHSFLVVAIPSFANVWGQNYFLYQNLQSKVQQLLMLLGNGGAAVSLFFVLSGFVLSQSFKNYTWSPRGYFVYLIKRIIRLYPVYLFTISLIAIFTKIGFEYRTFPHASTWYHWWMNFNLDWVEFLKNTLFIHINLGGVTWTLRVIFIVSFFMPLLYLLSTKATALVNLCFAFALIYLSFHQLNIPGFRDLRYLYMFYFGLILPMYEEYFKKIPFYIFYSLLPFLLICLLVVRYQTDEYIGGVFETVASWIIFGFVVYQPTIKVFRFLENKFFLFLGRISYGLYLVHFSVLYCLARIMFQYFPQINYSQHYLATHLVLLIISLLITIPISIFVHQYVETPPGNYITSFFKRKKLL